jgi:hypothetical protein
MTNIAEHGKLKLSLVHSPAAVPSGRISNSTTTPSANVGRYSNKLILTTKLFYKKSK